MSEKKTKRTAINLKGDVKTQFEEIKKKLGLDQDTEVIRFLISDFYKRLPQ